MKDLEYLERFRFCLVNKNALLFKKTGNVRITPR